MEDCPDLSTYNFNDKVSYITVFSTDRPGFFWARNSIQNGQFVWGHWERARASGNPVNTIAVVSPPLPPPLNYRPSHLVIDENTPDPVVKLLSPLGVWPNPVQVVELSCNVDLDMTGFKNIVIGDNRSLIASPACARGPRSLGPRIRVRDKRDDSPLFEIRGDNVRFSGFRLEGPTPGIGEDNLEIGIQVAP